MDIHLSERLQAAASLVRGGGVVADIGTDHGYLLIALVQSGKIQQGIGADIGKMPLENARKSVQDCGLEDCISLRLSDGLGAFSPEEAQEFVFAGMGGTLIAQKLSEAPWIKNKAYHFVFQPQSRAEDLREYLYLNGFEIGEEKAVHESRRVYICFDARYTGELRDFDRADCFLGKLPKSEDGKKHILGQLKRLKMKYDSGTGSDDERTDLLKTIKRLEEFLYD